MWERKQERKICTIVERSGKISHKKWTALRCDQDIRGKFLLFSHPLIVRGESKSGKICREEPFLSGALGGGQNSVGSGAKIASNTTSKE